MPSYLKMRCQGSDYLQKWPSPLGNKLGSGKILCRGQHLSPTPHVSRKGILITSRKYGLPSHALRPLLTWPHSAAELTEGTEYSRQTPPSLPEGQPVLRSFSLPSQKTPGWQAHVGSPCGPSSRWCLPFSIRRNEAGIVTSTCLTPVCVSLDRS